MSPRVGRLHVNLVQWPCEKSGAWNFSRREETVMPLKGLARDGLEVFGVFALLQRVLMQDEPVAGSALT